MKWKRSRKAQQESKNKDNRKNDGDKERSSSSLNQTSSKNANNDKNGSNFQFPKSAEPNPHPAVLHQRHPGNMSGPSKDMMPPTGEEMYGKNRQPSVFTESGDMIWRVV